MEYIGTWNFCGARVHRIPSSGATVNTFISTTVLSNWVYGLAQLNPSIVVLQFGVNENAQGISPSTQTGWITTLITRIRAAIPTADILLVPVPDISPLGCGGNINAKYKSLDYANAQYNYALANGYGFVHTYDLFGMYSTSSVIVPALWQNNNGCHVSLTGGQVLGNLVGKYLLQQVGY